MALREFFRQVGEAAGRSPALVVLLLAACGFGAWRSMTGGGGEWDSPLALLLLAAGGFAQALLRPAKATATARYRAWFWLGLGLALMVWSMSNGSEFGKNSALMLGCLGMALFLSGCSMERQLAMPLILCFWILPFLENITLFLSYPLRLISTELTVGLLRGCGVEISSRLTTIYLGETQMAITDACSGVSQLGVLLLFAWILSLTLPALGRGGKAVWISLILPIVIIANAVRLLLTIGLFFMLGERAFQGDIHTALGYGFIVLSLGMMWGCGRLLSGSKGVAS